MTSRADEEALFTTKTDPDALILLDLSGSMAWNPAGDDATYGSTDSCSADTTNCSGTGCIGGFCTNSKSAVTYYAAAACNTPDTDKLRGHQLQQRILFNFEGRHDRLRGLLLQHPGLRKLPGRQLRAHRRILQQRGGERHYLLRALLLQHAGYVSIAVT